MTSQEQQKKILELEEKGAFDQHINPIHWENTLPVDVFYPYIYKGFWQSIADFFRRTFLIAPFRWYQNKFVFKTKVVGKKNLKGIRSAIVTCNHFTIFDSLAVKHAVRHKMKYCVAEFNNFKGFLGDMMRASGILPLSEKYNVMKVFHHAIEHHLLHNNYILFYPERAMWQMYEKPRPLKDGPFRYAKNFHVPVVPIFITFRDSGKIGKDGLPIQYLTVNILKPIYPTEELSMKQDIVEMKNNNFNQWKETYEKAYQKPLVYHTKNKGSEK